MKRTLSAAMSLLLAAATASAQIPASTLAKIGTAAAVRGAVSALSAGSAVGHVISSGKPLYQNDHVTTDAAGRLQVLLLDETIFTLGPSSDMVLDEFVFDPKTSAGKISASISKGTFRFVTGKIAQKDPEKMKIKVAVGTIGVRGSIGVGEVDSKGATIINGGARNPDNHDDSAGIYAQGGGKTVNLTQPGVGTRIGLDGNVEPARFMTGDLNRIMGSLQTKVTQNQGGNGAHADVGGRRTASDASGRSTAVGGLFAADDLQTADLTSTLNETLANTILGINGGEPSSWDVIRGLSSGVGTYAADGTYFCSGGSNCSSVHTGNWDFNVTVNFGSHLINGGMGATSGPLLGALSGGNFSGFNYSTLSGPASFAPSILGTGSFSGTTLTLIDRGGTIAQDMTVELHGVSTGGDTVKGTATGSR